MRLLSCGLLFADRPGAVISSHQAGAWTKSAITEFGAPGYAVRHRHAWPAFNFALVTGAEAGRVLVFTQYGRSAVSEASARS